MISHKTGTREEWLTARLELLKAEKELTRRSDELARQRQELPCVRIDKQSFLALAVAAARTCMCLPCPLSTLRISAGWSSAGPNQCGMRVSNSATSPALIVMSRSPRISRACRRARRATQSLRACAFRARRVQAGSAPSRRAGRSPGWSAGPRRGPCGCPA